MTAMCWVNLSSGGPSAYRSFVAGSTNWALQTNSTGTALNFGTFNTDNVGSTLTDGIWYHIAGVLRKTSTTHYVFGYINGQLNVTGSDPSTWQTYASLIVGNSSDASPANPLDGTIRDARFWTQELRATDIVGEMNSSIPIHRAGLLAWYPLDDNLTGDRSGNNYTLTDTGALVVQSGPLKPFPKKRRSFP